MAVSPLQNPLPLRPSPKKGPDSAVVGLLTGILFPMIGLVLLFFVWSGNTTFPNYLKMFVAFDRPTMMTTASKALSLSVIANLLPFYFFLNRKLFMTVRGLLMSMVLFLLLIILYKYVWQ